VELFPQPIIEPPMQSPAPLLNF